MRQAYPTTERPVKAPRRPRLPPDRRGRASGQGSDRV